MGQYEYIEQLLLIKHHELTGVEAEEKATNMLLTCSSAYGEPPLMR